MKSLLKVRGCDNVVDLPNVPLDYNVLVERNLLTDFEAHDLEKRAGLRTMHENLRVKELCDEAGVGNPVVDSQVREIYLTWQHNEAVLDRRLSQVQQWNVDASAGRPMLSPELETELQELYTLIGHASQDMTRLQRYPYMAAPGRAKPGTDTTVLVGLNLRKPRKGQQPDGVIAAELGDNDQIVLTLPRLQPDQRVWKLDVVLHSEEFEMERDMIQVELPPFADSGVAMFKVHLPMDTESVTAGLTATILHGSDFIGQLHHDVTVSQGGGGLIQRVVGGGRQLHPPETADATLGLYVSGTTGVGVSATFEKPGHDGVTKLINWEREIPPMPPGLGGGLVNRSADPLDQPAVPVGLKNMKSYGKTLWGTLPDQIKNFILELHADSSIESLLIKTDVVAFPWELVVPLLEEKSLEPLGERFAMARWYAVGRPRPTTKINLQEVVGVFPNYEEDRALHELSRERRKLAARYPDRFHLVKGQVAAVEKLFLTPPSGVLHYAGHGKALRNPDQYLLELEDGNYDSVTLSGLTDRPLANKDTLVFFNACSLGQGGAITRQVSDGWASHLLSAGANAFIGALWQVDDTAAALFTRNFYKEVDASIAATGKANLAEILQCLRRRGREDGIKDWHAYILYGRPETVLMGPSADSNTQHYSCER